jgi:hypothetical protein
MSKHELSFYVLFLFVPIYIVSPILETPHPGRQPKHGLHKKIQYIPRLTEECMVLYSSVNQEYNGHVAAPQGDSIFIGFT